MRITSILVPALVGFAVFGAYTAGRYVGKHDAIKATQQILRDLDSTTTAEALFMIGAARNSLRQGQAVDADRILLRYAALKAPALLDCANQRTCTQLGAGLMPTKEQLEKVLEEERRLKEVR